jgi:hypothetical protein
MRSCAAGAIRFLRLRRARALELIHRDPAPPPAPSRAPRSATVGPARARGFVLKGPGPAWDPAAHLSTSSVPAAAVRALRGLGGTPAGTTLFGTLGDTTVLLRDRAAERMSTAFRRAAARQNAVRDGPRVLHAAGMGLTAAITREDREGSPTPQSLLRLLSSTKGPQQIGIGWLSQDVRALTAAALYHSALAVSAYIAWMVPAALPWIAVCAALAYATRPNLASFRAFLRERAPDVARRRAELIDRIRARTAPYLMAFGAPPVVSDYGLFTVVTVRDYADYIYVYCGCLNRWCLLGWYRDEKVNYDVDRVSGISSSKRS